jgi:glucokinase
MDNPINVGIDIGGTKVNMGLVRDTGEIIASKKILVEKELDPHLLIKKISTEVNQMVDEAGLTISALRSIGVGVPGTVDSLTGFVEYCPNLGWEDVPAGDLFRDQLGRDVIVAQDSRAAAWAEYLFGAGRKYKSMICLTLGTGIGCGIIIDGKIFHGAMNTAGELGHTIFEKDGLLCNCGNRGCLERYTSGTGILERALLLFPEKLEDRSQRTESVFDMAYEGDQEVLAFIRTVVEDLAIGIANAVSILSPEAVILSGGLCEHEELIIKPLPELVEKYGYRSYVRKHSLKIEKAQMGSDAPMIGAAMLYKALETTPA